MHRKRDMVKYVPLWTHVHSCVTGNKTASRPAHRAVESVEWSLAVNVSLEANAKGQHSHPGDL